MTRNFVDLSSNNGPHALNAPAYAKTGHVLVAVKATQGTDYVNPDWASTVHEAHLAHLPVLHYHFASQGPLGPSQAKFFLDRIASRFHRYDGIALDLERGGGIMQPALFKTNFDEFCIAKGHKNLVVYTEQSYHEEHGLAPKNGRLWIADYSATLNRYWAQQYTPAGIVHGIEGPVDVSRLSMAAYLYHRTHKP